MRRALGQIDQGTPAFPFTKTEQHLYGDAASIPAQFRHAIAHANREQLEHVTDQLEHLVPAYLHFVADASAALAKNDKFMPPRSAKRWTAPGKPRSTGSTTPSGKGDTHGKTHWRTRKRSSRKAMRPSAWRSAAPARTCP